MKVAAEVPTLQVPKQAMLPPVKDFDFQISKVPVAPTGKNSPAVDVDADTSFMVSRL